MSQRAKDFGIRMAMGAVGSDLFGVVIKEALAVAGSGAIARLLAVVAAQLTLQVYFDGILQSDWWITLVVTALLLVVAALASALPGWRATSIDTAVLLRES